MIDSQGAHHLGELRIKERCEEGFPRIQFGNLFDIVLTQLKIESVEIFDDPFFTHRFRNNNDFTLNKTAQHDLSYGLIVFLCDRSYRSITLRTHEGA